MNYKVPEDLKAVIEELKNDGTPCVKIGFLKHDLYEYNGRYNRHLTKDDILNLRLFDVCARTGMPFLCFNDDGKETWESVDQDMLDLSCHWADENLSHIIKLI